MLDFWASWSDVSSEEKAVFFLCHVGEYTAYTTLSWVLLYKPNIIGNL